MGWRVTQYRKIWNRNYESSGVYFLLRSWVPVAQTPPSNWIHGNSDKEEAWGPGPSAQGAWCPLMIPCVSGANAPATGQWRKETRAKWAQTSHLTSPARLQFLEQLLRKWSLSYNHRLRSFIFQAVSHEKWMSSDVHWRKNYYIDLPYIF